MLLGTENVLQLISVPTLKSLLFEYSLYRLTQLRQKCCPHKGADRDEPPLISSSYATDSTWQIRVDDSSSTVAFTTRKSNWWKKYTSVFFTKGKKDVILVFSNNIKVPIT
jgi:hypothetical protein